MEDLVIVRGGGDIATGTIYKLVKSGFHVSHIHLQSAEMLHFQKQYTKENGRLKI